jgi:hypothetical protein
LERRTREDDIDMLTTIGVALLSSFGGALGFIPLEMPDGDGSTERQGGPSETAITAVIVGPVAALIALLVGMTQYS